MYSGSEEGDKEKEGNKEKFWDFNLKIDSWIIFFI